MRSVLISAFIGFSVTLGAFALFADNSFWSQGAGESAGYSRSDSATLALTSEPSIQDSRGDHSSKESKKDKRKPQNEEMSIALRPKSEKPKTEKKVAKADFKSVQTTSLRSASEPKLGAWSVQIASYKSEKQAQEKLSSMSNQGFNGFVEQAEVNGAQVFRVKIGPVETKTEAQSLQSKLAQLPGLSGSILSKAKN